MTILNPVVVGCTWLACQYTGLSSTVLHVSCCDAYRRGLSTNKGSVLLLQTDFSVSKHPGWTCILTERVPYGARCGCVWRRLLGLKRVGGGYFTTKMASLCVGCVWALSITANGPQLFWADVIPSRLSQQDCRMPHVDLKVLTIYAAVKSVFVFFTPLAVTWISYCSIIYRTHRTWKTVTIST